MVKIYCQKKFLGSTRMINFSVPGVCEFETPVNFKEDLLLNVHNLTFKSKTLGGMKIQMSVRNFECFELNNNKVILKGGKIKPWESV